MASFFMKGTEEKKSWKISSGFKLTFHQKWHSMVEKPKWKFDRHVFDLMMLFGACPRFFCSDVLTVTKQFMLWHCHYLSRLINSKTSSFYHCLCLLSPHQHMCNLNWDNRRLECHDFYVKLANRSLSNREGKILAKVTKCSMTKSDYNGE